VWLQYPRYRWRGPGVVLACGETAPLGGPRQAADVPEPSSGMEGQVCHKVAAHVRRAYHGQFTAPDAILRLSRDIPFSGAKA